MSSFYTHGVFFHQQILKRVLETYNDFLIHIILFVEDIKPVKLITLCRRNPTNNKKSLKIPKE